MAPNRDEPRRNLEPVEDNPFIAFRRFADSQVSSLFNTMFTLPATLANFNNAYHAREQCLFGRADSTKCEELQQMENEAAKLRARGRELYSAGDIQAVLEKAEELMKLDRDADVIRKDIVEMARGKLSGGEEAQKQKQLVEKVANEKGQHWGWSWSWGFPKPFDEEHDGVACEDQNEHRRRCRRWRERRLNNTVGSQSEADWESSHGPEPRTWQWSYRWPPPADPSPSNKATDERPQATLDGIAERTLDALLTALLPRPLIYKPESYSPRALENDEDLRRAGVQWRDAFEDLVRADQGVALIPEEHIGESGSMPYEQWTRRFETSSFAQIPPQTRQGHSHQPKALSWEDESNEGSEPSYEYGHDHEDQHDDPPTPRMKQEAFAEGMPETELDAYERLLGPKTTAAENTNTNVSILSTLTTTERSVAPDGSVTTKVVLKKRFADGREESSETVHTQRGQQMEQERTQDPWKAMQEVQFPSTPHQRDDREGTANNVNEKKRGWFWSG